MPPKPHPKRAAIAARLRQGLSHLEIATHLGVSESLVAKVARVQKLTRRPGRRRGGKRDDVLVLAAEKVAPGEIALVLNCSRRLVDLYLQEARSLKLADLPVQRPHDE